jgi:energy-coupling factor transport system ATP-binding protein
VTSPSQTPVVVIEDLSVRWPADTQGVEAAALTGVTLSIAAGEVVGIVGETGSGRSTLVRALNGIVPRLVDARVDGRIDVAGLDPATTSVADMATVVAVVLDDAEAQMTQPTVADEVAFGLENLGVAVAEIRMRVAAALERVGLAGIAARHPLTLSGGEQQRLAIACAIAMRPRLLVMDEPTANLDPGSARRVFELARDVASMEPRTAVLIVAHDVELLAEHADRIVWIDRGRIRLDGPPGAVFAAIARTTSAMDVPAVTELCARLDVAAESLPVTVQQAVPWLRARA